MTTARLRLIVGPEHPDNPAAGRRVWLVEDAEMHDEGSMIRAFRPMARRYGLAGVGVEPTWEWLRAHGYRVVIRKVQI